MKNRWREMLACMAMFFNLTCFVFSSPTGVLTRVIA